MDLLRSIFNYVMRLLGAYIKHEVENTFRSPQQQRDFNPDVALRQPPQPAPTHKRIVTSESGRLAATCPAGWFSETGKEDLAFGTSLSAIHEGIGNMKQGEIAVFIEAFGSTSGTIHVDMFKQLIEDHDSTIYADHRWSQAVPTTVAGKNAAVMTGTSEYGDQVLILIGHTTHVFMIVNTAEGESARFEQQYREIADSVIYQA